MAIEYVYEEPNPKQKLFFLERHKYVAYGGARGGGKSWAVRRKAALMCFSYPGIRIGIFRRTYPELKANHIDNLISELGACARYVKSEREFIFVNGSRIKLIYADCDADLNRYQGTEFDVLFIDEATQIEELWYNKLKACVRGVNHFPKRIYLTCNPGGVGHGWVKRLFILRSYTDKERGDDYAFIQATVKDNKALQVSSPEYLAQLESLPKKLREAWLYGSWDIFEGQFFEDFIDDPAHYLDRRWSHVIEPFEVPEYWPIYRSFDWGYAKPFSCDWWALDGDGRAYLIYQYYGCRGDPNEGLKLDPYKVFAEVRRIEREHRWLAGKDISGVADPALWGTQTGESVIEVADKCGVYFRKGDNTRLPGWMQVHYRLSFDEEGRAMMYFFNTCRHAIRTLPLLQFSETNPEDLDSDGEDHFADSMRYFCMSRPIKPVQKVPPKVRVLDPLDRDLGQRLYRNFDFL